MKIVGNTIFFRSNNEMFYKEESGVKSNTVRFLNKISEIEDMVNFQGDFILGASKNICITHEEDPNRTFTRQLTDISQYPGKWVYIFSWKP